MNIKQQFFNELSEVLEKEFPKGERCSCGKKLPCRSKALVLNAYANLFFIKHKEKIINQFNKDIKELIDQMPKIS